MKKLIGLLLFLLFSLSLYAVSTGNMQFNVHWNIVNIKTTTLTILPYSGSGTLPQDLDENYLQSFTPNSNSALNNVCQIKYATNVKGTHKIEFSATPLTKTDTLDEYPYSLHITTENEYPVELDVDPEALDNSKLISFIVIGAGETTVIIRLDAVITAFNIMQIGDYNSYITITDTTE